MSSKSLPRNITSYDLLKTFAVLIMVIDHAGLYFFPDDLWWRAVGRVGFPIWFFLVGHASGRDLPQKLLVCAGVLIAADFVIGREIFPVNALVTIIFIRLLIDPVMRFSQKKPHYLWVMMAFLVVVLVPTYEAMEYGTIGLLTAMFGYMVRHCEVFDDKEIFRFMVLVLSLFLIVQYLTFEFSVAQFAVMAVGTAFIRLMLLDFKAKEYPLLTASCVVPLRYVVQFCGRKTLDIYVYHLLAFKVAVLLLGAEGYGFFEVKWY